VLAYALCTNFKRERKIEETDVSKNTQRVQINSALGVHIKHFWVNLISVRICPILQIICMSLKLNFNIVLKTVSIVGPFPGAKARQTRDADHSLPSSAEVENEQELYLLSLKHLHGV
jgi:hypothetical protein